MEYKPEFVNINKQLVQGVDKFLEVFNVFIMKELEDIQSKAERIATIVKQRNMDKNT
jgi:hypothetical protein